MANEDALAFIRTHSSGWRWGQTGYAIAQTAIKEIERLRAELAIARGAPCDALLARSGVSPSRQKTADHYSKQWSAELGFSAFIKANPEAAMAMPGRQLGWPALWERIRSEAGRRRVSVYDAACGFGDIAKQLLADPAPPLLDYLGADIHHAIGDIDVPKQARFLQWDITEVLRDSSQFDFVVCRAALHHTPEPAQTYRVLAAQLAPGGTLAISVYAKKAPIREAMDDALRSAIVPMTNDKAFAIAAQFTKLGRDLQASDATITIAEDLPFLGIKAGTYKLQAFVYDHFIKCWHNPKFAPKHCDLVNFDWYHPPHAFRFTTEELAGLALDNGLAIKKQASIAAQHYLEAERSPV